MTSLRGLILFIYISLFCFQLHAEMRAAETELRVDIKSPLLKTEAELSQVSFMRSNSAYFGSEENAQSLTTIGMGVSSNSERVYVDGHWFYVPQEEFHYFNVPELSFKMQDADSVTWIGRHIHNWSEADEFWAAGIWQPRFMWDYLTPQQNGLTGVHYSSATSESSQIHLFVSSLFVPDMSPRFRQIDGKIVAKNPWIRTPPPMANLFNEDTPIAVGVEMPTARDVLLRPSVAVQYQKKWNENLNSQVAYAYKPVNNLRMSYEYYLQTKDSTSEAIITAYPTFPYEQVATLESTVTRGGVASTLSVTHQSPVKESVPQKNISQNMPEVTTGSLTVQKQLDAQSELGGRAYFGVIKVWTPTTQDIGENVPEKSLFMLRPQFYLAYRAGVERPVYTRKGRPILARLEGTYDSDQEAAIFTTAIDYNILKNLNVNFAMSFLGATSDKETEYENGMIRTFRANDNLSLGMNYVF
ncbi:MAG: hypothetical protein KDD38_09870 [Bdellovibrionales bacterium]|nr:hypothetical protein [Bdellovibrionales bacterium]